MRKLLVFAVLAVLFGAVTPAEAHGYIVRAVPEDRAVFDRSPTRLQYWFSEGLEPEFSSLNVRDSSGEVIATGGVDDLNNTLLRASLPPNLPDGAYIVELRPAFASDGHVVAESRVFFVGEAVGGVSGQSATDQAIPLEVVWRGLSYAASVLLFGVFVVYSGVLVPAWGSRDYPAGLLPPRVMTRLNRIAILGLVIAFGAAVLSLLQQSMAFFGVGLDTVLQGNLWAVVRIGSRFGDLWNFRVLFLVIVALFVGAAVYYRQSQPATVRAFWTANAWTMALVLGTYSAVSHAAGSLTLPWVGVAVDWLHLTAVGFWVGGLVALVLVLPAALQPYAGEQRRLALLAVLRRYSRFALVSAAVVMASGAYSALNWIERPDDLATTFGVSLLIKVGLIALLLAFGALHHIALNPERYARFRHLTTRVGDFATTLRAESVMAVAVLSAAGLLTATPVPVPEFAQAEIPAPSDTQTVSDYTVDVTITPGGPGVNTYDVVVTRDGQPVDDLDIAVQQVAPARDRRGERTPAELVDSGVYVSADDAIDEAGLWWTLVDIHDDSGELTRAAFAWDISADASVIESRPPSLLNLLALAGVVMAGAWAISPLARRLADILDWRPELVLIGAGAIAATIFLMAVGFVIVRDNLQQYEDTLNPPPAIVNTQLPTAESLARGATLFDDTCAAWEDADGGVAPLIERLPRTRDDELYTFIRDGWLRLPPCDTLTESQRWDVVNYVRALGISMS